MHNRIETNNEEKHNLTSSNSICYFQTEAYFLDKKKNKKIDYSLSLIPFKSCIEIFMHDAKKEKFAGAHVSKPEELGDFFNKAEKFFNGEISIYLHAGDSSSASQETRNKIIETINLKQNRFNLISNSTCKRNPDSIGVLFFRELSTANIINLTKEAYDDVVYTLYQDTPDAGLKKWLFKMVKELHVTYENEYLPFPISSEKYKSTLDYYGFATAEEFHAEFCLPSEEHLVALGKKRPTKSLQNQTQSSYDPRLTPALSSTASQRVLSQGKNKENTSTSSLKL